MNDVNIKRAYEEYNGFSACHVKSLIGVIAPDDGDDSGCSKDFLMYGNDSSSALAEKSSSCAVSEPSTVKQKRSGSMSRDGKEALEKHEDKPRTPRPNLGAIAYNNSDRSDDDMCSIADCVHAGDAPITAHIVSEDDNDLRDQVRMEIFSQTVEAKVVKESSFFDNNRNKCLFGIFLFIVIVVVIVVVGVVVGTRETDGNNLTIPSNTTSQAPSEAPSFALPDVDLDLDRALELEQLLQPISTTSIRTPQSPQRKAFVWLAGQQSQDNKDNNQTIIQKYILAVFYYSLGGKSWSNKFNFLSKTLPFCEWRRPRFANSKTFGVECNGDGDIVTFGLALNGITGSIPQEIGYLSKLSEMFLENNFIRGTLPTILGLLTNLRTFDATNNLIEGTIPEEWFELKSLRALWLDDNPNLNGTIPANIGNATSLEILILNGADLSGSLPESLGTLSRLRQLNITTNKKMRGPLPTFVKNFNFRDLSISQTSIGGTIPSTIGNLINLQRFEAADTNISGTIPIELANLTNLQHLHISPMLGASSIGGLTGTIPAFQSLKSKLNAIILPGNSLSGNLDAFFNVTKAPLLRRFNFNGNRFTGTIPSTIGICTNIRSFVLGNNKLTGPIPIEFQHLEKIESLSLEFNSLTGTIPSGIGKLSLARFITVNSNALTGTLPKELGSCSSLQRLSLKSNQFTGKVPFTISNLSLLRDLSLERNKMTDDFTDTFCSSTTQKSFTASISADCVDQIVCDCCSLCL